MESNAYILGTEQAELHRLGLQHQVWASEARRGWKTAEFGNGQTILDLGCGPGFTTFELGYMVGETGKVIAVDKSETFINHIKKLNKHQQLNIDLQCATFDEMQLEDNCLDGIYDRWALAWTPDAEAIINKLVPALKQGGVVVMQEYYDWSVFQIEPNLPNLTKGVNQAFQTLADMEGEINIGKKLPALFANAGLEVIAFRPMTKCMLSTDFDWQWPRTFFSNYLPKLIDMKYLTEQEVKLALEELDELSRINGASILCPQMVEVIAVKV